MQKNSKQELTFPLIPFKDIAELFYNAFGLSFTVVELANPTPQIVTRIYGSLLELITETSRDEVSQIVNAALETLDTPELYRDALLLLSLFREMEFLCRSSRFDGFRMEDLTAPTGPRLQRILSALLNFGRFKEDVMRQHAQILETIAIKEQEVEELNKAQEQWEEKVKQVKQQLAKDEPEREAHDVKAGTDRCVKRA